MAKEVFTHYVNALPTRLIADDHYFVRTGGNSALHYIGGNDGSAIAIGAAGSGDMVKSVYDNDDDGMVDIARDSETLGGVPSASYALKTDVPAAQADKSFIIAMAIALG